jgi:hypothetical protein
MRAEWFFVTLFAFAAVPSLAQELVTASAENYPSPDPPPTVRLALSEEKDTPRVSDAEIAYGPIGCSRDGAVLLETSPISDLHARKLSSVGRVNDKYAVISFPMDKITDVHDAQFRAFYATQSLVAVLVNATADDAMSTSKHVVVVPSTGERYEQNVRSGTRHDYIATFDRQGNYKEAVELNVPFKTKRIAVFNSDLYLAIGYDTENKPRFAFVNSDGSLQRLLDTEKPMLGWEGMTEATGLSSRYPAEFRAKMPPQFGMAQIVSFHDKLLFVLRGLTWIVEISPSGLVRRIPIQVPEGSVIDHFVPSQKMWYASFRKYGVDLNGDMQSILYEINPLDGMPIRRFDTSPEYVAGIACEHDGEFRALAFDTKGLRMFRATPQN